MKYFLVVVLMVSCNVQEDYRNKEKLYSVFHKVIDRRIQEGEDVYPIYNLGSEKLMKNEIECLESILIDYGWDYKITRTNEVLVEHKHIETMSKLSVLNNILYSCVIERDQGIYTQKPTD